MRILFVWSSAEFSTWDVARGYREAFAKQGHDIRDYRLYNRIKYHVDALGEPRNQDLNLVTRLAAENVVVEAMRHQAQMVFIVSGMGLHPDAVWFLRLTSIPTVVLFTESPYNDPQQREFAAVYPAMKCFTNERISAVDGWSYVAHAHDPAIHYPRPKTDYEYDVLMIGTLWQERVELLEQVDWTGIKLKLIGTWAAGWPPEQSPLEPYYEPACITNSCVPEYLAKTKICINPHRAHPDAESLNPRAYELAACGAFQLSDPRAELNDVFGSLVDTFTNAGELEDRIRYWLERDAEREERVGAVRVCVEPHTFDVRAKILLGGA